jgi:hypothetical protein
MAFFNNYAAEDKKSAVSKVDLTAFTTSKDFMKISASPRRGSCMLSLPQV